MQLSIGSCSSVLVLTQSRINPRYPFRSGVVGVVLLRGHADVNFIEAGLVLLLFERCKFVRQSSETGCIKSAIAFHRPAYLQRCRTPSDSSRHWNPLCPDFSKQTVQYCSGARRDLAMRSGESPAPPHIIGGLIAARCYWELSTSRMV